MPFQSAPGCASAVVNMLFGGVPVVNVFNFHKTGGYLQIDLDNLAAEVDGQWPNVMALLNSNLDYIETHVRGLESVVDLESSSNAHGGIGGDVTEALPNNVAFVLTQRTGHTGRSARGRTYITGLSANSLVTTNTVTTTFSNGIVGVIHNLFDGCALLNWDAVVLSRFSLGVKRPVATFLPITLTEARNNITDSQRNRLPTGH